MQVRMFRAGDEADLAEIFFTAVHEVAGSYYSGEQVKAWAPNRPPAERFTVWATDGRKMLVATDENDRPLAFGDLEPDGHIDHLFCRPAVAGTGVAASLYRRLEVEAVKCGISLLYVEASEPARRFFLKHGFEVIERRDFDLAGVPIHNFRMEKRIDTIIVPD